MKLKLIAVAVLIFPLGCGKAMTSEQKLAMLEAERAQIYADLHRQKAECQAQAIEFSGDRRIVESCLATLEAMASASSKTIANIDRRIEEIGRAGK